MKTANHIESSVVFLKLKSGNTLDEAKERKLRRSSRFWVKVLDRILSIILTVTTLYLALRGHREEAFEGNCKGGKFLGFVALLEKIMKCFLKYICVRKLKTN